MYGSKKDEILIQTEGRRRSGTRADKGEIDAERCDEPNTRGGVKIFLWGLLK